MPMPDSIRLTALEMLYKELKRLKKSLGYAEERQGVTQEEIDNINTKIRAVDYLIGLAQDHL